MARLSVLGDVELPVLRCTARMLDFLGDHPDDVINPAHSDNDWYTNLFWVERKKCILLTHAGTLYSAVALDVRKADVRDLGRFVRELVGPVMTNDGLNPNALLVDLLGPPVAKTASRKTVAAMTRIMLEVEHGIAYEGGMAACDGVELNRWINDMLRSGPNYFKPREAALDWKPRRYDPE